MLQSDFLFAPTRVYLEIVPYVEIFLQAPRNLFPFGARFYSTLEWNSKEIPFRGFLFAFTGASELLPLVSLLEFSRRCLGTNSIWRPFGSPLGFAIPGDSFPGIPPCFPPLWFILIFRSRGTTFTPVGGLLFFSFLAELHQGCIKKVNAHLRCNKRKKTYHKINFGPP